MIMPYKCLTNYLLIYIYISIQNEKNIIICMIHIIICQYYM